MKKILCIIAVLTLFFTGCANKNEVNTLEPIPPSFTADITADYGSAQFGAQLNRTADGLTVSFTSPEVLNGLTASKNLNGSSIDYLGLSVSSLNGWLPQKSVLNILSEVLNAVCGDGSAYSVKNQNGCYIYEGTAGKSAFELVRDCETLNIKSVSVPEYGLTVTFNNFTK